MQETSASIIRLLFQIILAILQFLAALGLLIYLIDVGPDFGSSGGGMIVFLLGVITFAFVHSIYRIVDGIMMWRLAVSKAKQT
ncbi:MAG: hypothetical protein KAW94_00105 [Candidatus Thorarchaeota archaeon]|nr:hypothetical protein [Candidatus Thorarchaeota archaeon]